MAWSAVSGFILRPRRLKTLMIFSRTSSFLTGSPPKISVSTPLVMSSLVGPRPPVVMTRLLHSMARLMAEDIASLVSPTVSTDAISQPRASKWRAMKPELVSVTRPRSSSSPMTTIESFMGVVSDSHAGVWRLAVAAELFIEIFVITGYRHHRGIVGCEGAFGDEGPDAATTAEIGDSGAHT